MADRMLRAWLVSGLIGAALAAVSVLPWDRTLSVGIAAGGAWNLLNLWCLARTLSVWLSAAPSEPRRRRGVSARSIAWLVIKFPLLYAVAVAVLLAPGVSPIGFGIGFIIVLGLTLITGMAALSQDARAALSHGR